MVNQNTITFKHKEERNNFWHATIMMVLRGVHNTVKDGPTLVKAAEKFKEHNPCFQLIAIRVAFDKYQENIDEYELFNVALHNSPYAEPIILLTHYTPVDI